MKMISYDGLKRLIRESVITLLEGEKAEECDECEDGDKVVDVSKKAGKRKKKLTWVSGKKKPDPLHHIKGTVGGSKVKKDKNQKDDTVAKGDEKLQKSVEYLDLEDGVGEDIYDDVVEDGKKGKHHQKKKVVEGRYSLLKILN